MAKIGRPDKAGLATLSDTTTRIRRAVESVIEGKRDTVRLAITVMLAEGHLLIEDVPGRRQDDARQGAGPLGRLLRAARPVHARTCCPATSPASRSTTRSAASSSSSRARSSRTSWSATRSTAPPRRPSPRCSSAWRSGRSPSTARPTSWPCRSWSSRPRTRSRWRAPIPLPEAQRDRFMARLSMGYPDEQAELPMLDTHGQQLAAGRPDRRLRRHRDRRADPDRARHARLRPGTPVRRRPRPRHPQLPRASARRLAARHPAPDPRRPGGRRARRPRLRPAGRRAGPRRRRARAPAAADRGGSDRPALDRGHRHRHRGLGTAPRRAAQPAELASSA